MCNISYVLQTHIQIVWELSFWLNQIKHWNVNVGLLYAITILWKTKRKKNGHIWLSLFDWGSTILIRAMLLAHFQYHQLWYALYSNYLQNGEGFLFLPQETKSLESATGREREKKKWWNTIKCRRINRIHIYKISTQHNYFWQFIQLLLPHSFFDFLSNMCTRWMIVCVATFACNEHKNHAGHRHTYTHTNLSPL